MNKQHKKPFSIKIRKRITGKYISHFASLLRGPGIDAEDGRKYVSGDATKYINRKVSAKLDELYIDLHQQDRDVQCDIFFDINSNWHAGFTETLYTSVEEYFADIALYCMKQGISMQLFYAKENNQIISTSVGKDETILLHTMEQITHHVRHTSLAYRSDIHSFLELAKRNPRKRVIVIFSDFLDLSVQDAKTLSYLSQDHIVILLRLPIWETQGYNYEYRYTKNLHPETEMLHFVEFV